MVVRITEERIKRIIDAREELIWEPFPCITIVAWNLPSGFTIVENSGCIDPEAYDRGLGIDICRRRLENKVWELEGYARKLTMQEGLND